LGCKFAYSILLDGDVAYNSFGFENSLLTDEPAVGFVTATWAGPNYHDKSRSICVQFADAFINAFHRSAMDWLLPYYSLNDKHSWYTSQFTVVCLWKHLFPFYTYAYTHFSPDNPVHHPYPKDGLGPYEVSCKEKLMEFGLGVLIGSQNYVSFVESIANKRVCTAQLVQPWVDSPVKFLGKRDFHVFLEKLVNGRLEMIGEEARMALNQAKTIDEVEKIMGVLPPPSTTDYFSIVNSNDVRIHPPVGWDKCVYKAFESELYE
jgi:hypothetical protein